MSAIPLDPDRTPSWKQHGDKLSKRVPEKKFRKARDLGIIDPWDSYGNAPEFALGEGILPKVYEDYVQDNIAEYGGDPAAYACAFLAMHCGVLHSSVQMQTRPMKDNWRNPNEHSLTLGKSGANKSGMFKDLTKHQWKWQVALSSAAPPIRRRGAPKVPLIIVQAGSIEAMLQRVAENKGERLIVAEDEAMGFFLGAGAHHQKNSISTMVAAVCKLYDCEPFTKILVNAANSYSIPELCGTMLMATVFDKFAQWEAFPDLVKEGMMSRFTVGLISNPIQRDGRYAPTAEKAMGETLHKLRAMRDVRFALSPEAAEVWMQFIGDKEERNAELDQMGDTEGLTYWCKKYDTRIMSMATIFQAYEYTAVNEEAARVHEYFDVPKTAADMDKVGGDVPRQGKLVHISYENLERAIDFVEGFLYRTQAYFYSIAQGSTEFQKELKNWVARHVTIDDPEDEKSLIITRNELTNQGPMMIRAKNGVNDRVKELQRRWVRALLDHGFLEVADVGRKFAKPRADDQAANYRIRDEFFVYFDNRRVEMQKHDAIQQGKLAILRDRLPLRLGPKRKPSEEG